MAMDQGCVCCSLRNDIVRALRELQGRAERTGSKYDAILLETTGLADPAPVAFTFFSNPWISANFRLDSILTLVDAQHIREVSRRPATAVRYPPPEALHRRRLDTPACSAAQRSCCSPSPCCARVPRPTERRPPLPLQLSVAAGECVWR